MQLFYFGQFHMFKAGLPYWFNHSPVSHSGVLLSQPDVALKHIFWITGHSIVKSKTRMLQTVVLSCKWNQLAINNFLQDLRKEGEFWDWLKLVIIVKSRPHFLLRYCLDYVLGRILSYCYTKFEIILFKMYSHFCVV